MSELDFELECHCEYCGHEEVIKVNEADYDAWTNGGLIQDLMSYLSPSDRELIIRNTCGECFDKLFPPLQEEE